MDDTSTSAAEAPTATTATTTTTTTTPTATATATAIPLFVSNGQAFVWSVEDANRLRAEYRVCGVLTGSLPHAAQQNLFLGIPLVLLPEEVVLLLHKRGAYLMDDNRAHTVPTEEQLLHWNQSRKTASLRAQQHSADNQSAPPPQLSEAALQKRLERQKRKDAKFAASESHSADPFNAPFLSHHSAPAESAPEPATTPSAPYPFRIPAASADLPWYTPSVYDTLQSAREANLWSYPSTSQERAKCAVFIDLWEKGYYMGNGLRFGGDWLVYPGDPLRYHSHFVASVHPTSEASLDPMKIVAYGRLGTATKKSHLLCGWDETTDEVTYISIEWANFG